MRVGVYTVAFIGLLFPLVKETKDLSSSLFAASFLVRHDSVCGRKNNVSELTTGQKVDNPLFDFTVFNIESGADNTALVQSSVQFNDNLIGSVIIDNFKFPNVSCEDRNVTYANGATQV